MLDNTKKNVGQCKTVADGLQVENCFAGFPFPFPKTGSEVMWNRLWKFDAFMIESAGMTGTVVDTQGNRTVTGIGKMWIEYPIYNPAKTTPVALNETYGRIRIDYTDPPRKAGEKLIVLDGVDMVGVGRKAFSYLPGQRRVKLAPDIAYDTPSPTGGGAGTVDEAAVWYGSLDRYNFKLIGKKEMYIPYNSYKLDSPSLKYDDVIKAGHINQDLARYELHRVWEVVGTVKPSERHIYAKRHMYFDEDSWQAALVDHYDGRGQLWRVAEGHAQFYYDHQNPGYTLEALYDIIAGRYIALGMKNEEKHSYEYGFEARAADYTPAALRSEGVR